MKIQSIFSICLACYLASLFWACAQTVSSPEESSDKDEISQEEDSQEKDVDEEEFSGEVTAPPLKEPSVENDSSSEAKKFFDGLEKIEFLSQYDLHGSDSQIKTQLKEMKDTLQKGEQLFDKAAKNEKWFIAATIQKGNLYLAMANSIKNQKVNEKSDLDSFATAFNNTKQLPSYYEQARTIFQEGLDKARSKKISNSNLKILEEYFIYTYYESCNTYREISFIYPDSPLPDSAAIVEEYIRYEKASKDDAIEMTHEDLGAYREALDSKFNEATEEAISHCEDGILAAQEYNLKNEQVEATRKLLRVLDPNNSVLQ